MSGDLHFCEELESDPTLYESVLRGFAMGQREGAIPERRDPPDRLDSCAWVGTVRGYPQGFATFRRIGHGRCWLDVVFVFPACRQQGIGRRLVEAVTRVATRGVEDCDRVEFGTNLDNVAMQKIAAAAGFRPCATLYEYSEPAA